NLQTHSGPAFKDFGNVTAVAGQAQFINLTLTTTGVYTLIAHDVTNPGNPPDKISPSLTITASKVHFVVQPPPVVKSGAPFSVEADAVGEDNSLDTTFNGQINLTSILGISTLNVTKSATAGRAVFTGLILDHFGQYQLVATSPGLTQDESNLFEVTANHMVFV